MNKFRRRYIVIAICTVSAVLCIITLLILSQFILQTNSLDNNNTVKQEEMLNDTLEWGRLAPLPDSKKEFEINTEGGMFTRSYRSSFYLPEEDLDNWIKESPGLQDAEITTLNETTKKYVIDPGGGAAYAQAEIDFDKCYVQIYTYWS